eukprot:403354951
MPLRVREKKLKKVFLSPTSSQCLSPCQSTQMFSKQNINVRQNSGVRSPKNYEKVTQSKINQQQKQKVMSKIEKEMLEEIKRNVQVSRKAALEINKLKKSIKQQSQQLKTKEEEIERREQQYKLERVKGQQRVFLQDQTALSNCSKSRERVNSQSRSINNRSNSRGQSYKDASHNNSRVRFADQHQFDDGIQSRSKSRDQSYYSERSLRSQNSSRYLEHTVSSAQKKKNLQRLGQQAINITNNLKDQQVKINSPIQTNLNKRLFSPQPKKRSSSKNKKELSRQIITDSYQSQHPVLSPNSSKLTLMKNSLQQSLAFIRSQGAQVKNEIKKSYQNQAQASQFSDSQFKKQFNGFSPVLQKSMELSNQNKQAMSQMFSQKNLFSPTSSSKNFQRNLDLIDLQSNNESLYQTCDSQKVHKDLKSIMKTHSELDKLRLIKKQTQATGSSSHLFSISNKNFQSKSKRQFMNFICESSDSEESTNSDINSNYI